MKISRVINAAVIVTVVVMLCGCGEGAGETPPKSGPALQKHLLKMLERQREAILAGNLDKARADDLPYSLERRRVFWELMGKAWNRPPTPQGLAIYKSLPVLFSGSEPIQMELSGDWAYLRQKIDDDTASRAFFVFAGNRWWIVEALLAGPANPVNDQFKHLRVETYWPDHITDYFLLLPVELHIEPSNQPADNEYYNWRLSLHVTNTSSQPISAVAMRRWFTHIQYVTGASQSATKLFGGPPPTQLKPGETRYIGDVQICKPDDPTQRTVFYAGPYVSNALMSSTSEE